MTKPVGSSLNHVQKMLGLAWQLWCGGARGGHEKKASRWWWKCDCWFGLGPSWEGQKEVVDAEWLLYVGSCF